MLAASEASSERILAQAAEDDLFCFLIPSAAGCSIYYILYVLSNGIHTLLYLLSLQKHHPLQDCWLDEARDVAGVTTAT